MVNFHYHFKCQDITDNACDNKLILMISIQMIIHTTGIIHLDKQTEFQARFAVIMSGDGKFSLSPQMSGYY